MQTDFSPKAFFDLESFEHQSLLAKCEFVWDAIPKIRDYILSLFKEGKIKANFGKDIYLGEGTEVAPGVYIEGPAIIGKNCRLGHAAYLRENIIIGDNCIIGHGTEVKNSVFLPSAVAAHLNYIGDSILGNSVNVAAGVILANFRLDQKSVQVKIEEKIHDTNLTKLGAIIGDSTKVGVNSVLNPGTLLGKNCHVYPLTNVRGYHAPESKIR